MEISSGKHEQNESRTQKEILFQSGLDQNRKNIYSLDFMLSLDLPHARSPRDSILIFKKTMERPACKRNEKDANTKIQKWHSPNFKA